MFGQTQSLKTIPQSINFSEKANVANTSTQTRQHLSFSSITNDTGPMTPVEHYAKKQRWWLGPPVRIEALLRLSPFLLRIPLIDRMDRRTLTVNSGDCHLREDALDRQRSIDHRDPFPLLMFKPFGDYTRPTFPHGDFTLLHWMCSFLLIFYIVSPIAKNEESDLRMRDCTMIINYESPHRSEE